MDVFCCDGLRHTKEEISCVMECVGQKFGAFDEKGDRIEDTDTFHKLLKDFLEIADWQLHLSDEFLAQCDREIKELEVKHVDEDLKCNPSASHYSYCMWKHFAMSCPTDLQIHSRRCERLKSGLEQNTYPLFRFPKDEVENN